MYRLRDDMELKLNQKRDSLLNSAIEQSDITLRITKTFGVDHIHLVYFILGMLYVNLQTAFVDLYRHEKISDEIILREDWETYWKDNYTYLINKIQSIYNL